MRTLLHPSYTTCSLHITLTTACIFGKAKGHSGARRATGIHADIWKLAQ